MDLLALAHVTGGVAPFTYAVDGGGFTGNKNYTNLSAGPHTVTVKDANGCEFDVNAKHQQLRGPLPLMPHQPMRLAGQTMRTITINGVNGGSAI
jgi:hypothetical protein